MVKLLRLSTIYMKCFILVLHLNSEPPSHFSRWCQRSAPLSPGLCSSTLLHVSFCPSFFIFFQFFFLIFFLPVVVETSQMIQQKSRIYEIIVFVLFPCFMPLVYLYILSVYFRLSFFKTFLIFLLYDYIYLFKTNRTKTLLAVKTLTVS